jgi:thiol-disulfide isomerase/thioredoxin
MMDQSAAWSSPGFHLRDMKKGIDMTRRHVSGAVALTLAAAGFALADAANALARRPTEGDLPSFDQATGWLNSPPLAPDALRGKVVLVQFWTYTCINWLRTLPYVRAWASKYKDNGLVVIGVHAPEFGFEKDIVNVRRAVSAMRIDYPVAVDSDHAIWRAFGNEYWPALYFIDARGRIRHHKFGEGDYPESERIIQGLLAESGKAGLDRQMAMITAEGVEAPADWDDLMSPENYLGYERTRNFASPGGAAPDTHHVYSAPSGLSVNEWALSGGWTMGGQPVVSNTSNGRIACRFHARDLHMVLGPGSDAAPVRFRVSLDGAPPGASHGFDVDGRGEGMIAAPRLYQLVRQAPPIGDRLFTIEFLRPGVEAFAFTFG